jgi:hypothetical protein
VWRNLSFDSDNPQVVDYPNAADENVGEIGANDDSPLRSQCGEGNVQVIIPWCIPRAMARRASSAFAPQAARNARFTMNGLKVNDMDRKQVAAAVRAIPGDKDFVWDGADEDDRPLTREEMRVGIAAAKKRGRPAGGNKEQVAIRWARAGRHG